MCLISKTKIRSIELMNVSRLFPAFLVLIFLLSSFGAQGQYATSSSPSTVQVGATSQYAEYYTMPGSVPGTHISAPVQFDITGKTPTNLYFSTLNQAVPYQQYMSNPANSGAYSLWIQGTTNWAQYTAVPLGASLSLMAVSPTGGSGYLNEIRPDGTNYNSNFYFFPYSMFTFYADTIGRHILSFVINGQQSNTVIIDVTGTYVPPVNYYMSPSYYQTPFYYNNFPGFFGFNGFDHGFVSSGNDKGNGGNGGNQGDHGSQGSSGSSDHVVSGSSGNQGDKGTGGNSGSSNNLVSGGSKRNESNQGKDKNN